MSDFNSKNIDSKSEVIEGKAKVFVATKDIVDKKMEVFYNPVMKFNRDSSILFLNAYFKEEFTAALPLAGSGIRGVRFLLETKASRIYLNDMNPKAIESITNNFNNNIQDWENKIEVQQKDANVFLRTIGKVNYVDIDPYGSSLPFIESALQAVKRNGILAITNTDTAALCGSYPKVTKRRYGATPFNYAIRQQFGLRILVKKAQEIAARYDIALIPVFAFSKDHYMRVFFKVSHSKEKIAELLEQHKVMSADNNRLLHKSEKVTDFGPIYSGLLYDKSFLDSFKEMDMKKSDIKFLEQIKLDAILDGVKHFFDPHEICKMNSLPVPSYDKVFDRIKAKGFQVSRTHYYDTAFLTDMNKEDVVHIILDEAKKCR